MYMKYYLKLFSYIYQDKAQTQSFTNACIILVYYWPSLKYNGNGIHYFYCHWCSPVCHSTCQTCTGPLDTDCTSCSEGLKTDIHRRCATPTGCPSHHYSDRDGACHLCHKHCHQCSGPDHNQCLSCYLNHYLLSESKCKKYTTALCYTFEMVSKPHVWSLIGRYFVQQTSFE